MCCGRSSGKPKRRSNTRVIKRKPVQPEVKEEKKEDKKEDKK